MSAFASLRPTLRQAITASAARTFSSSAARAAARITITGRLAATPEAQATSTGKDIIRYAVASSYGARENRKTSWFQIASFAEDKQRDYLLSLAKGTLLYVEGDAKIKSYEDSEGRKQTALNITQRYLEVLQRPNTDSSAEQFDNSEYGSQ
ncbi:ssDNA binding protein [Penicillium angulare]|uniref:ssDNA binding protein n=1 Tax=Penicillium angulare TaxID=116970 RepID=UPI0025414BF2|nr:ssDNA binding protein [Penicillium angulare]KAJ5272546.1 ssDNA binding protein [Penicillium angulare]